MIFNCICGRSRYTKYPATNVRSSHGQHWRATYGTIPTANSTSVSTKFRTTAGRHQELVFSDMINHF